MEAFPKPDPKRILRTGAPSSLTERALFTRMLQHWTRVDEALRRHRGRPRQAIAEMQASAAETRARGRASEMMVADLASVFEEAGDVVVKSEAIHATLRGLAHAMRVRAETGRYPTQVPGTDLFSGKPLRVRTEGRAIWVYSVGADGVDDQGRDGAQNSDLPGAPPTQDVTARFPRPESGRESVASPSFPAKDTLPPLPPNETPPFGLFRGKE